MSCLFQSMYSGHRIVSSVSSDGSTPPSWIPFGKGGQKVVNGNIKGFKAMKNLIKENDSEDANDPFATRRKNAVEELVKGSSGKKVRIVPCINMFFLGNI